MFLFQDCGAAKCWFARSGRDDVHRRGGDSPKGQECQFVRDPAVTKLEVTRKSNVDQISAFAAHMKAIRA